jgi:hypothetical protein
VTIRYDGNVGIGTTSPGYLLDLGYGDIRVQNGGNVGGAGGAINFGANAGCGPMAQIKGALETAAGSVNDQGSVVFLTRPQEVSPYTVRTNLTERMRITSGGNVGIGTTSSGGGGQPKLWSANDVTLVAGNYAGDVNAQIMAVGTTNPLKRLALMYDTTNNIGLVQAMIAGTGTSPLCLNAAGGNVGIGTASPGYLLDVSSFGVDGGTIRIASSSSCQFRMMEANDSYGFSFTNVAASRLSIKRHSASVGGTEVISILRDTGLVGIGTVSPGTILDVYTADSTYGMRHTTGTVSMASFISSGSSAAPAQFGTTTNHKLGFFTNNGTPNVVIDTSGRLGIGTGSPATTLDVRGPAPAMSLAAGYYFQNNTPSLVSAGAGSYGVQAYFSSTVAGGAFQAFSDRRIKKDIVDVHDAVSTINKIRPVSYHYIDELEKGAGVAYGFIAQEVEQVLPDSTKKLNEFVPNIFRVADSITGNTISVVDHGLTVGSQVKFISKDVGWWESNVVSVDDENTFTVEKDKIDDADLFVYGEKVKDYRTLDYEHVFSVGIAAIQELSAENTALKARLDSLEQRLAAAGL